MDFLPVDPLRTEKGALVSLTQFFPEDAVLPQALSADDDPFTNFNVVVDSLSIHAAAKLGIGAIFGGFAEANEIAVYMDAVTYTEKFTPPPGVNGVISATRWGAGLRIAFRVKRMKTDLNLTLPSISAGVQLGLAQARYHIQGLGIGREGLAIVLGGLTGIGEFTPEAYYQMNTKVIDGLKTYITSPNTKLTAVPIGVVLSKSLGADLIPASRDVLWSMKRISEQKSLDDAIMQAGLEHDAATIRSVYASIVGAVADTTQPSRDARDRARDWLNV